MAVINFKYYIGTIDDVVEISNQEAIKRGCDGVHTVYWWQWVEDGNGNAALQIPISEDFELPTVNKLPKEFIQNIEP